MHPACAPAPPPACGGTPPTQTRLPVGRTSRGRGQDRLLCKARVPTARPSTRACSRACSSTRAPCRAQRRAAGQTRPAARRYHRTPAPARPAAAAPAARRWAVPRPPLDASARSGAATAGAAVARTHAGAPPAAAARRGRRRHAAPPVRLPPRQRGGGLRHGAPHAVVSSGRHKHAGGAAREGSAFRDDKRPCSGARTRSQADHALGGAGLHKIAR